MPLPRKVVPQSYSIEANSLVRPSIADAMEGLPAELFRPTTHPINKPESTQHVLEATSLCREELSPAGFRKNLKSLTKNVGECQFSGGMRARVTVPKSQEWKLKLKVADKSWLRIK